MDCTTKKCIPDQHRAGDLQHAADPAAGWWPGRGRLLPKVLAMPLARLEPFGLLILIGLLILLPVLGAQLGLNLDVISVILRTLTGYVIRALLFVTGNA
jgi:hypothetical protein